MQHPIDRPEEIRGESVRVRQREAGGEDDEWRKGHIIWSLVGNVKNTRLYLKSKGSS